MELTYTRYAAFIDSIEYLGHDPDDGAAVLRVGIRAAEATDAHQAAMAVEILVSTEAVRTLRKIPSEHDIERTAFLAARL